MTTSHIAGSTVHSVATVKFEMKENACMDDVLFLFYTNITLIEGKYFSKTHYRASFLDPILSCASVART
jgi:hypothetical protein